MEDKKGNYIKNTKTSGSRTVRVEVIGGVDATERAFLDGMAFFMAGTIAKPPKHTKYVCELMGKLSKHIVDMLRDEDEQRQAMDDKGDKDA